MSSIILSIENQLQRLGWLSVERNDDRTIRRITDDRLFDWCVSAIKRANPQSRVEEILASRPFDRYWWVLCSMLTEKALATLDAKLKKLLEGDREANR